MSLWASSLFSDRFKAFHFLLVLFCALICRAEQPIRETSLTAGSTCSASWKASNRGWRASDAEPAQHPESQGMSLDVWLLRHWGDEWGFRWTLTSTRVHQRTVCVLYCSLLLFKPISVGSDEPDTVITQQHNCWDLATRQRLYNRSDRYRNSRLMIRQVVNKTEVQTGYSV